MPILILDLCHLPSSIYPGGSGRQGVCGILATVYIFKSKGKSLASDMHSRDFLDILTPASSNLGPME